MNEISSVPCNMPPPMTGRRIPFFCVTTNLTYTNNITPLRFIPLFSVLGNPADHL